MRTHVVVVRKSLELRDLRRSEARDGWRVFRSKRTGFEIAIPSYQLHRVEAIARKERNEWYALAVGEVIRDDAGTHAVVRDFVPNDWAERGPAHVRMGANAESEVRTLAKNLHPDATPLGNLHTHPRYTTEPSGTDRQEFWRDPNSVSIIVDPFDHPTVAVYRGREGERLSEIPVAQSSKAFGGERPERSLERVDTGPRLLQPPPVALPSEPSRWRIVQFVGGALLLGLVVVVAAAWRALDLRIADAVAMDSELAEHVRALEMRNNVSERAMDGCQGDELQAKEALGVAECHEERDSFQCLAEP